ncbi:MAG TPA: hypothetical protein VFH87_10205 [Candidatus Udaeobacter sp.]|nr:hypothetical protein [Candidatus Udaeobacter sp.]
MKTRIRKNLQAEVYFDFIAYITFWTRFWRMRCSSTSGFLLVDCLPPGYLECD